MVRVMTQSYVNSLSTVSRCIIADGGCRGLYLDVRPKGSTYRFRFTDAERQQRNLKIGDASLLKLSEARQMAYTLARRLALGENIRPQKEAGADKPTSITFGEFIENRYLPHVRLTRRNYKSEISALNKHILPVFGQRPLLEIRKGDVISFFHAKSVQKKKLRDNAIGGQGSYELDKAMRESPVTLYSHPDCKAQCQIARDTLNKRGIPFQEIVVDTQPTQDELKRVSGGINVPVLVVGGQVEMSISAQAYDRALDLAGYPRAGIARPRSQAAPPEDAPADAAKPAAQAAPERRGPYAPR